MSLSLHVADSSTERNLPVKKSSTKCRKCTGKSAEETGAEVETAQCAAGCHEEQKKCKRDIDSNARHTPSCKLFIFPQSGLYEYFLAKLKRPAYLGKMRKQLIKHEGRVRCGKDVVCIARKHLTKLLKLLNKTDSSDGLKNTKKQTARTLSRLLQEAMHL